MDIRSMKVTLSYPLHTGQLYAVEKWLKASELKAPDLEIAFCDPSWDELASVGGSRQVLGHDRGTS